MIDWNWLHIAWAEIDGISLIKSDCTYRETVYVGVASDSICWLAASRHSIAHSAVNIPCLKHRLSNSPMAADRSAIVQSSAQTRWEARTALKCITPFNHWNYRSHLWTYYRSSLDIPSYRLCSKFVVLYRQDLHRFSKESRDFHRECCATFGRD